VNFTLPNVINVFMATLWSSCV